MKDITIQNMVASVDLFSSKIPLTKFVKEIENVTYNPKKFPGACLRLEKPRTSILVFDSGKIVVSGAKNEKDIKKSIKELKKRLRKLGITFIKEPEIKIQNVVASGKIGFKINLDDLAFQFKNSEYNPEQFPGLVYKPQRSNVSFLLFNTGKIVCTGAKNEKEIIEEREELIRILKEQGYDKK